jgi:O-antigen/teichoic acid export membrane protein
MAGKKRSTGTREEKREVGAKTAGVASLMIFGRFITLFISGIAFIVIARVLGPSVYGIYVLAISFAGFFGAIADLGVNTAVNKFIGQYLASGKHEDLESIISNGYASVILSGLAFTIIAFLMAGFIAVHLLGSAADTYVVQIASFTIIAAMMFALSYYIMIGFGKGKYVALVIVIQSIFQGISSILLALLGFGALAPILGLLIGYSASITSVLLLLVTKFKIRFRKPSMTYMKKLLGFSSPISVYNGLRGFIANLAPIVLSIFATTVIVGNFGVAIKTSTIIGNVTDALGLAVLPMFAYTVSAKSIGKHIGKFYNYAAYMTFLLLTPALLYLTILSKEFSFTVFSAKYLLAPSYISVISAGMLIWILATYTSMLLISTNRVKEILKYSIIIACIELVLLFTVVPLAGGLGLVFVLYVITPLLILLFMSRAANRLLNVRPELGKLGRVVVAGVISALFLLPLPFLLHDNYILILVVGAIEQVILYPPILTLSGAAGSKELKTLREVTSSIPVMNRLIEIFASYSERFIRKSGS